MLSEFELGEEAAQFIRSQFALGRGLGSEMAGRQLPSGRIVTFLPPTTNVRNLRDFDSGGVANGEEATRLAELIGDYLARDEDRICVFEHAYAQRGDPILAKWNFRYFLVPDDVYLFVDAHDLTEDIARVAREAHLYPSIGVLATLPSGATLPANRSDVDPSFLQLLSESADHIVIGAYDGEAWLIWSRR